MHETSRTWSARTWAAGDGPDAAAIADEVLAALDARQQIPPFTRRVPGFDLAAAYRVAAEIRRRRTGRGERPVGRKLGFTNRNIWPEFGVYAPVWADLFDSTLHQVDPANATFDLAPMLEPRIEPEIAFGLARAPEPGMDEAALLGCIGWIAHGIEIVQSVYPGWSFEAADTVAASALHGAYLLGPRQPVLSADPAALRRSLGDFSLTLIRDGALADTGHAANVLDGPLPALRHLVELLGEDPANPPLAAGEIVTTGTVTRALPVAPGEVWETRLDGLDLPGLRIAFG